MNDTPKPLLAEAVEGMVTAANGLDGIIPNIAGITALIHTATPEQRAQLTRMSPLFTRSIHVCLDKMRTLAVVAEELERAVTRQTTTDPSLN